MNINNENRKPNEEILPNRTQLLTMREFLLFMESIKHQIISLLLDQKYYSKVWNPFNSMYEYNSKMSHSGWESGIPLTEAYVEKIYV